MTDPELIQSLKATAEAVKAVPDLDDEAFLVALEAFHDVAEPDAILRLLALVEQGATTRAGTEVDERRYWTNVLNLMADTLEALKADKMADYYERRVKTVATLRAASHWFKAHGPRSGIYVHDTHALKWERMENGSDEAECVGCGFSDTDPEMTLPCALAKTYREAVATKPTCATCKHYPTVPGVNGCLAGVMVKIGSPVSIPMAPDKRFGCTLHALRALQPPPREGRP